MSISRRDFMKLVGVSVASLFLTRCRFPIGATCYAPMPPTPYPTDSGTARGRLRRCWLRFGELAEVTRAEAPEGDTVDVFGQQLVGEHRLALDDLVGNGDLTPPVADLVQEAYTAAVYHVWRSNASITCYAPTLVNYAPAGAEVLVQQSDVLNGIAAGSSIDPATLAKARAALEHDMAYYALTDEQVTSLYDRIVDEWQSQQKTVPDFEVVDFEITPDAKAAAGFIISLLTAQ